jgi:murein DD-endopeptidase MepM/ murein hydrolase activator NlpD
MHTDFSYYKVRTPKRKKRRLWKIVLMGTLFFWGVWFWNKKDASLLSTYEDSKDGLVMGVEDLHFLMQGENEKGIFVQEYTISQGDIPADVFFREALWGANDLESVFAVSKDVYDLTNLKIGNTLRCYFDGEERAVRVEYDRDTEEKIVIERDGETFSVFKENIPYKKEEVKTEIVIDSFLYKDALESGLQEGTIIELADVFAYAIDFTTEIQTGDQVKLLYEQRSLDGERGPDGRIKVAKFTNQGEDFYAYYFEQDGEGGYYDGEGHAIVRQFLKAPLSYARITSGYTGARLHPITRTVTAHYQIDYAAPTGTPVVSTARGTVTSAGWENGWGYIVRVRHDNGYTTHYAHLSGFASGIRSGSRVTQGQLVGYVGSTGWSTGPHLDYGMRLNGAPINPLTLVQPKGPPLEGDAMEAFQRMREEYQQKL